MKNARSGAVKALTDAARDSSDVIIDYLSLAADAAVDSELFEKVPVLSTIVKALAFVDAGMKIKLARNVAAFLNTARSGDPDNLAKAYDTINGDPRWRDDVPDTIMQILTDAHKPLKVEMVARMTDAVGAGALRVEDFNLLCLIVLQASIPSLRALEQFGQSAKEPNTHYVYQFRHQALILAMGVAHLNSGGTSLTNLGHKLLIFGFGHPIPKAFTMSEFEGKDVIEP